jgi:hypothetical protein
MKMVGVCSLLLEPEEGTAEAANSAGVGTLKSVAWQTNSTKTIIQLGNMGWKKWHKDKVKKEEEAKAEKRSGELPFRFSSHVQLGVG